MADWGKEWERLWKVFISPEKVVHIYNRLYGVCMHINEDRNEKAIQVVVSLPNLQEQETDPFVKEQVASL